MQKDHAERICDDERVETVRARGMGTACVRGPAPAQIGASGSPIRQAFRVVVAVCLRLAGAREVLLVRCVHAIAGSEGV